MKGLGFLKWDLYARANDPTFNRYCHKFVGFGFEVFVEAAIILRKNDGKPQDVDSTIEDLAIITGIPQENVRTAILSAINDYKLFKQTEDGRFYSSRVYRDVQASLEKSKQNSENATSGWEKRRNQQQEISENNANALQTQSNPNATVCQIRGKRKEIRDKSNNITLSNTNVLSNVCGEPKNQSATEAVKSPVFLVFETLKGGGTYAVTEKQIAKWQETYPAIDVKQEVRAAQSWLDANPQNKKSNIPRYLNNWLARSQDRARPSGNSADNTIKGTDISMTFRPNSLNAENFESEQSFDALFEQRKRGAK